MRVMMRVMVLQSGQGELEFIEIAKCFQLQEPQQPQQLQQLQQLQQSEVPAALFHVFARDFTVSHLVTM